MESKIKLLTVFTVLMLQNVIAAEKYNLIIQESKMSIRYKDAHHPQLSFRAMLQTNEKEIKKPLMNIMWLVKNTDGTMTLAYGVMLYIKQGAGDSWMGGLSHCKEGIKKVSEAQSLVPANLYKNITINNGIGMALLNLQGTILCHRVEVWIDGKMVGAKDSLTPALLKQQGIPENWYIVGENVGKIKRWDERFYK